MPIGMSAPERVLEMTNPATSHVSRQRLASGCCPVHDKPLARLSLGEEPESESSAFDPVVRLGRCPCSDCSVLAWLMPDPCDNALLGPWAHLCDPQAGDRVEVASRLSRVVLSALK